ncbi:hypothetical protein DL768_010837 [Monosporascus sp. mg162]|nr:hypothetical protein DL768_010837 [Monosporascus sp. mg162]
MIEQEVDALETALRERYGRPSWVLGGDKRLCDRYLRARDRAIGYAPSAGAEPSAGIFSNMDEDLSKENAMKRKVEAINAMVAYAFVHEAVQRHQRKPRENKTLPPSHAVLLALPGRAFKPDAGMTMQSTPAFSGREWLLSSRLRTAK